jgi:predicted Zn-dependent protease
MELIEIFLSFKTKYLYGYNSSIDIDGNNFLIDLNCYSSMHKRRVSKAKKILMENSKCCTGRFLKIEKFQSVPRKSSIKENTILDKEKEKEKQKEKEIEIEKEKLFGKDAMQYIWKSKINKFNIIYNQKYDSYDCNYLIDPYKHIIKNINDLESLIIFTDADLFQDNPENEIVGKTINMGGKIAIVSLNNKNDSDTIITCLHEALHTFGIYHCNIWKCLMNPYNNFNGKSIIDVCPLCLMKLKFYKNFDLMKRYKSIKKAFNRIRWFQDEKDCKEKIDVIKLINLKRKHN